MANLTRAQLIEQIAELLADNTSGDITPAILRSLFTDVADSAVLNSTDAARIGLRGFDSTRTYAVGDCIAHMGIVWQFTGGVQTGTFTPSQWRSLASGLVYATDRLDAACKDTILFSNDLVTGATVDVNRVLLSLIGSLPISIPVYVAIKDAAGTLSQIVLRSMGGNEDPTTTIPSELLVAASGDRLIAYTPSPLIGESSNIPHLSVLALAETADAIYALARHDLSGLKTVYESTDGVNYTPVNWLPDDGVVHSIASDGELVYFATTLGVGVFVPSDGDTFFYELADIKADGLAGGSGCAMVLLTSGQTRMVRAVEGLTSVVDLEGIEVDAIASQQSASGDLVFVATNSATGKIYFSDTLSFDAVFTHTGTDFAGIVPTRVRISPGGIVLLFPNDGGAAWVNYGIAPVVSRIAGLGVAPAGDAYVEGEVFYIAFTEGLAQFDPSDQSLSIDRSFGPLASCLSLRLFGGTHVLGRNGDWQGPGGAVFNGYTGNATIKIQAELAVTYA